PEELPVQRVVRVPVKVLEQQVERGEVAGVAGEGGAGVPRGGGLVLAASRREIAGCSALAAQHAYGHPLFAIESGCRATERARFQLSVHGPSSPRSTARRISPATTAHSAARAPASTLLRTKAQPAKNSARPAMFRNSMNLIAHPSSCSCE